MKRLYILLGLLFLGIIGYGQISDDSLRSYADTYINTNGTGSITGAMMNNMLNDLVDSKVNVDSATVVRISSGDDTLFITYYGYPEDTIPIKISATQDTLWLGQDTLIAGSGGVWTESGDTAYYADYVQVGAASPTDPVAKLMVDGSAAIDSVLYLYSNDNLESKLQVYDGNNFMWTSGLDKADIGINNVAIGNGALRSINSNGDYNFALGTFTLVNNVSGDANVGIGINVLRYNQTGSSNVAIGHEAMRGASTKSPVRNTAIGYQALYSITTSDENVGIGYQAGYDLTSGVENTLLGKDAGSSLTTAGNCVMLGFEAGENETNSSRLYIESSNSSSPLIGGHFDNDYVGINEAIGDIDHTLDVNGDVFVEDTLFVEDTDTKIYVDSDDTVNFVSNKPIKIGNASLIVETDGDVLVDNGSLNVQEDVRANGAWNTWSPSLTWGTNTPTINSAVYRYQKINKTIYFIIDLRTTNESGGNVTDLTITLPETPEDVNALIPCSAYEYIGTTGDFSAGYFPYVDAENNTEANRLLEFGSWTNIANGDTFNFYCRGFYEAD